MLDKDVKIGQAVRFSGGGDDYFGQVHGIKEKTEDSTLYEIRDYTGKSLGSMKKVSPLDTDSYIVWYSEASGFEPVEDA